MYVHKLERALWDLKNSPTGERPMHKPKVSGPKTDSIEFYQMKLDKYNARYAVLVGLRVLLATERAS